MNAMLWRSMKWLLIAALMLIGVTTAMADDDPSGRVARLRYMSGSISMQPGGVDDWATAEINRPLTTGDRLWADKDSRAELSMGSAFVRIEDETSITVSQLSDDTVQLFVSQGVLSLHVSSLEPGELYEIDTPNLSYTVERPGDYRFEVDAGGDQTLVIVRDGYGTANGDSHARSVRVRSNEQVLFRDGMSLTHDVSMAPGPDGFDDWCAARNRAIERAASLRYVSSDMIGYEDLDSNGYWLTSSEYGPVWRPFAVSHDWAPYRNGHWVWVSPWGWTWVDDAPWGFAPFHYGRWVRYLGRWAWAPGMRGVDRPIYSPAMVAWMGGDSFSAGSGPVAWTPLGWDEPYYPGYYASDYYVRRVNTYGVSSGFNVTIVINNYHGLRDGRSISNMRYMHSDYVTAISRDDMTHARPVNRVAVRVDMHVFRDSPVRWAPSVTPRRESVMGGGAPINSNMRRMPPPDFNHRAGGYDFERARREMERNGGRPLSGDQWRQNERAPINRGDDLNHRNNNVRRIDGNGVSQPVGRDNNAPRPGAWGDANRPQPPQRPADNVRRDDGQRQRVDPPPPPQQPGAPVRVWRQDGPREDRPQPPQRPADNVRRDDSQRQRFDNPPQPPQRPADIPRRDDNPRPRPDQPQQPPATNNRPQPPSDPQHANFNVRRIDGNGVSQPADRVNNPQPQRPADNPRPRVDPPQRPQAQPAPQRPPQAQPAPKPAPPARREEKPLDKDKDKK